MLLILHVVRLKLKLKLHLYKGELQFVVLMQFHNFSFLLTAAR